MGSEKWTRFCRSFCTEGLYVNEIRFHTNDVIGMYKMKQRMDKGKEEGEITPHLVIKYVEAKTPK